MERERRERRAFNVASSSITFAVVINVAGTDDIDNADPEEEELISGFEKGFPTLLLAVFPAP
jgi:hypothetical protein